MDETEILDQAFPLIFAFDEIVALGYRENVNLAQIRTFTEMDSHEEKVFQAVRQVSNHWLPCSVFLLGCRRCFWTGKVIGEIMLYRRRSARPRRTWSAKLRNCNSWDGRPRSMAESRLDMAVASGLGRLVGKIHRSSIQHLLNHQNHHILLYPGKTCCL